MFNFINSRILDNAGNQIGYYYILEGTYELKGVFTPDEHKEIADAVAEHFKAGHYEHWLDDHLTNNPIIMLMQLRHDFLKAHDLPMKTAILTIDEYLDTHKNVKWFNTTQGTVIIKPN